MSTPPLWTSITPSLSVEHGPAGWGQKVSADTTRDNAIINAEYQLGVDSADAANDLTTAQIGAEDSYAKDMIDIDADYAIAVTEKSAEVSGDIADAELTFELAEHTAGQTAGKAINSEEKDREDKYADADEVRAEALSLEEENLANDLAAEEETRQNSYASAEADWLSDEAAAYIASTTIAAAATSTFLTSFVGAEVAYTSTVAPLITTATQAFNNTVDSAYAAAFPSDPDQAAVSGAWTQYYNAMATAAENAITAEASAYQGYIGSMASDIQTTMNNVAGESTQLATDQGNAITGYISVVAAAGVAWVDSAATDIKNAIQSATGAWLQMADDGVDAAKTLADDLSNSWNGFVHNYLGAAVSHATNVINENRQAAKDIDSELTTLASGAAAEQHDLTLDDLSEWKSAALALSPLDDAVINAWAALESAWSIVSAWVYHADTAAAPLSDFEYSYPGGAGPMSELNHNLDLVGGSDEVVMQAALAAAAGGANGPSTAVSWDWWSPSTWSLEVFLYGEDSGNVQTQRGIARSRQARAAMSNLDGTNQVQQGIALVGGAPGAALDHAEDTAINIAMSLAGAGAADDALNSARKIRTGNWAVGSFKDSAESLIYHFRKHGAEVGAKDVDQYLRKAQEFSKNLRGARKHTVDGATEGVTRYIKNGKYIDLDQFKNIISFGAI